MQGRILVVEDHDEVVYAIRRVLEKQGLEVVVAASEDAAMERLAEVDAAVVDIRLEDGGSGINLLARIREGGDETPVIILSAYASPDNIVSASKCGAIEVLRKPVSSDDLVAAVRESLATRQREQPPFAVPQDLPAVLGSAPCMVEVFKSLGLAATNDLSVLLTGETGVGKDVAARIVHEHSQRSGGPFVALNSTAMPETLLEAELFGYATGAFTGAARATSGRVESAAGGTLFLDEIGDMPPSCQAKLLRFLEDRSFYRLGESTPRHVDVRLIAATNQDLHVLVEDGRFRRDLYYRLAQIPVRIPPLRERTQDIPALVEGFVLAANRELGLQIEGVEEAALDEARRHSWVGNVRELKNAVYRTCAKQKTGMVRELELMPEARDGAEPDGAASIEEMIEQALKQDRLQDVMQQFEQRVLIQALKHFQGNKSKVAEALDISRNTLRSRLHAFGIDGPCGSRSP